MNVGEDAVASVDRPVLDALYPSGRGGAWAKYKDHWMRDNPISWCEGATADDDGRVTAIDLWASFLGGAIPSGPGDLDRPFC